nr:glutamate-gated chloride channel, GluCl3 [Ixodes ricinus]
MLQHRNMVFIRVTLASTVLFALLAICGAQTKLSEAAVRIEDRILKSEVYDKRVRPPGLNKTQDPTIVRTNIYVRSLYDICETDMSFKVQLTFRHQWADKRLAFDDLGGQIRFLNVYDVSRLWIPDTFFVHEREGHFHRVIRPNFLVRIYPDGSVLYSVRVSLKLSCPMNFKKYPFDKQRCEIRMESYGHNAESLAYVWKEGDPVQVTKTLYTPEYTLEWFRTEYCDVVMSTGNYSCLKVIFEFQRETSNAILRVYIPCIMMVLLSWVPLWLNNKSSFMRVIVPILILMVFANAISQFNHNEAPKTSYTKAVDVWTGICLTYAFAVVVYVTILDYLIRHGGSDGQSETPTPEVDGKRETAKAVDETASATPLKSPGLPERVKTWIQRKRTKTDKADIIARIVFPALFVLFLIIYFCTFTKDNIRRPFGSTEYVR